MRDRGLGYNSARFANPLHAEDDGSSVRCLSVGSVGAKVLSAEDCFLDAFEKWVSRRVFQPGQQECRVRFLSARSLKDYWTCARALAKCFGNVPLGMIDAYAIAEYQRARACCDHAMCTAGFGSWARPCGSNRIRKEVDLLIRILRAARLWTEELKEDVLLVQREWADVMRSLDPDEQDRFLQVASSRIEWEFIYHYAILGLQTAAATNELRSLRLGDVKLGQAGFEMICIRSEGAKNKYRIRSIPLGPQAIWAMEHLLRRAREMGSVAAHHYLFPFRVSRDVWDPARPMSDSGLKKRWSAVREAAGLPWLRPYDLRHTGITRMAEAGVPVDVAMSLVGHMTRQMHEHYTAISRGAKRRWLQVTWDAGVGVAEKKSVAGLSGRENQGSTCFPQQYEESPKKSA